MIRTKYLVVSIGIILLVLIVVLAVTLARHPEQKYIDRYTAFFSSSWTLDTVHVAKNTVREEAHAALVAKLSGKKPSEKYQITPVFNEHEEDLVAAVAMTNTRFVSVYQIDGTVKEVSLPTIPSLDTALHGTISPYVGVTLEGTLIDNVYTGTYDALAGSHTLVGYALDGFGIYTENNIDDLDTCHGHAHTIMWDGNMHEMYHYHISSTSPYVLGCLHGADITSL